MLKSSNGLRVDNFFGAQRFFGATSRSWGRRVAWTADGTTARPTRPPMPSVVPVCSGRAWCEASSFFCEQKPCPLRDRGWCSGCCPEGPGRVVPKCAFMKAARSGRAAGRPRAGIPGMLHGGAVGGHLRRSRPSCDERCGRVSVPVALRAAPSMVGAAGVGVHPAVHPARKVRGQSGTARPVVSA